MKSKPNCWMSFVASVKQISNISLTAEMYHDIMKFYITGKTPEEYVNSLK